MLLDRYSSDHFHETIVSSSLFCPLLDGSSLVQSCFLTGLRDLREFRPLAALARLGQASIPVLAPFLASFQANLCSQDYLLAIFQAILCGQDNLWRNCSIPASRVRGFRLAAGPTLVPGGLPGDPSTSWRPSYRNLDALKYSKFCPKSCE